MAQKKTNKEEFPQAKKVGEWTAIAIVVTVVGLALYKLVEFVIKL